jgi:hypothetical protein
MGIISDIALGRALKALSLFPCSTVKRAARWFGSIKALDTALKIADIFGPALDDQQEMKRRTLL